MVNVHLITFCRMCLVWSCCDPLHLFYLGMYFIYPLLYIMYYFQSIRPYCPKTNFAREIGVRLTKTLPICTCPTFDRCVSPTAHVLSTVIRSFKIFKQDRRCCQSQLMSINSLNRLEDVKIFSSEFFIIYMRNVITSIFA